jgi:hypothetical protein
MISKLFGSPARKFAGGLALCTVAIAAQADPISLQGACRLTSIIAAQGQCQLEYALSDAAFTANIKSGFIKVDNIVIHRYVNDNVNPVASSVYALSGSLAVSCGATHVVTAFITRVGIGTVAVKVGSLPAVLCPTVP